MPKKTYGSQVQARVKRLLEALLDLANWEFEDSKFDIKFTWKPEASTNPKLIIETTLVALEYLTEKDKYPSKLSKTQIREALNLLEDFLKILEDNRVQTRGVDSWHFTLKLWSKDKEKNLKQFDQAWEASKPEKSKASQANSQKSNESYWQEICDAMLEKHKRLTTNELLGADDDDTFELEAIHVPLALVERKKPNKYGEDISPEQGSRLYEPSYEEKQRFEHEAFLEQIIRDGVGKTQGHRIALIGEPGAGKTTQLQTIAFWILDNNLGLPIWISLADLQGKSVENYLLQDWLKNALEVVRVKEEQENAFADLFKNNRVWLLLDAADEMSSPQPLTEISQQLTGWVKNARVVLTCRVNVWEANAGALENFETYRLLNFAYPQQVQEFIRRWFHNKDADKGEKLWQELDKAERQRIQDLVKNPLRLALLCSTWQGSDKGLPKTKAELYQHFVEEFYRWKKNPFLKTQKQQQTLNVALRDLAKRAIDTETSRFRLRHKFVSNELGDPEEEGSLFWLALKLGWLNEVGLAAESPKEKVYAFYHTTFEEYFAALAIENWDEFLNHDPDNPAQGVYRIFAPQWKEVILLWLGRREENLKQQKQEFIDALVNFQDRCGNWERENVDKGFYEYQSYFLAAAGIAEFKDCSQADEIVAQIVKWGFGYSPEKQKWVKFIKPIEDTSQLALQQTERTTAIAVLVQLLKFPNLDDDTYKLVVRNLGWIGTGNEKAIAALVAVLQSTTVDDFTRRLATENLGWIGTGNEKAIAALVAVLQSTTVDDFTRRLAAESLGTIHPAALVELPQSTDVSNDKRWAAAKMPGTMETFNNVYDIIMGTVRSAALDQHFRMMAAGSLGTSDPTALVALLQSTDKYELWAVAERLGTIGTGNEFAIAALVELLQSTTVDDFTRRLAAESLVTIGTNNEFAIAALVELLQSTTVDDKTRSQIAESLGTIHPGNEFAIAPLIELIGKPQLDDLTRRQAASSLEKIILEEQMPSVVTILKDYLSPETYKNDLERFAHCYEVIWKCAQSMPYPAFYQAWHQQNKVKDGE
ncbi:HEAT repeat domain-containing protein [Nostoc sp. PCC 9305]|uniref:HEAT repeat domain-containing protein n=1 Tax=Nostoc sp. PCC 9305 TaxID=296636 RepID=UPI0039C705C4